jgi:hypothetical protein
MRPFPKSKQNNNNNKLYHRTERKTLQEVEVLYLGILTLESLEIASLIGSSFFNLFSYSSNKAVNIFLYMATSRTSVSTMDFSKIPTHLGNSIYNISANFPITVLVSYSFIPLYSGLFNKTKNYFTASSDKKIQNDI